MIFLKIIIHVITLYFICLFIAYIFLKYAFSQIDKTTQELSICVHKIEWVEEYLNDKNKISRDLGFNNAFTCIGFYNRIADIMNNLKDDYFSGRYFVNKELYRKRTYWVLFTEIFRSKRYRKKFKIINEYIDALINLISLEKRYRLKEKDLTLNYMSLKTRFVKILEKIMV